MLFLAVFCGFLAENLREHQVEHQREKQYIRSLIADLKEDDQVISRELVTQERRTAMMDSMITILNYPDRIHGNEGNLYYALYRDVTQERTFAGVKMELFRQGQTLSKVKDYKPSAERTQLSKREEELVTLIKQGLSTKEIAWQLSISPNTVRNIKSKLFEKFNVSNSIELLNMAGSA